jgi:hypothetical protein
MVLKCRHCGVTLRVPTNLVKARFVLDEAYPGKPVVPKVVGDPDDDKEWN